MKYTVFIPTAGTGSRLGGITKYINKSLVSIGDKPTITRIFEMFPDDARFVIATGYKGELVKEYLTIAHPDKDITFVDVYPYEGVGSGLGLTLLTAKDELQEPFVFCSCDTLVSELIPEPTSNWMGWDNRDNLSQYRTLSLNPDGEVCQINEKGKALNSNPEPYIGLAGIHDYKTFWSAMETNREHAISEGEALGLRQLLPKRIMAKKFTWFDTGVTVELQATQERYHKEGGPNILPKEDESIWFLDDKVIKYHNNPKFISDRVKRAQILKGFVPDITGYTEHMYSYSYATGDVMSKCVTLPIFKKLLEFSKTFWVQKDLNSEEKQQFHDSCLNFYKKKTYDRVNLFYNKYEKKDNAHIINDCKYPTLKKLLDLIDWEYVAAGLPGQFHGDFHFENILYNKNKEEFTFLDWRQNFDKSLSNGDIYYDLAKMLHGLIMCHELVAKDLFEISWENETIRYDFVRKNILVECEQFYYDWLKKNGFDFLKVRLMTAIIFLNICGLHEYPYCLILYSLGKEMLYNCLKEENKL